MIKDQWIMQIKPIYPEVVANVGHGKISKKVDLNVWHQRFCHLGGNN
jgi:hypothetical protein